MSTSDNRGKMDDKDDHDDHDSTENNDKDTPSNNNQSGFLGPIVDSVFQPGVNAQVVIFLNIVFIALLILFIALAVLWELNIHVIILGSLTFFLIIAINW